jgi:hypothetical protein
MGWKFVVCVRGGGVSQFLSFAGFDSTAMAEFVNYNTRGLSPPQFKDHVWLGHHQLVSEGVPYL